jgi:ATP phosphoribosyltransferase regulatory subunit
VDASVLDDMKYYNGVVFKGFLRGVPASVLSGGQYDRLMRKLGKNARAVGFAVYLDGLERFCETETGFDDDVVLLYDDKISPAALCRALRDLADEGRSVLACREKPKDVRYRVLARLTESGVEILEADA